jgi:pullulanase
MTTVDAAFVATPGGDSGNISISIELDGTYLFSADVTNLASPTIYVSPEARYADTALYVRGSMNDGGATDEMTFDGVASYSLELDLVAGDYAFKVADADWAVVNFGLAIEGQAVTLSRPSSLTPGGDSQNINLTIPEEADGTYRFDFKIVDPAAPALIVSPVPIP